MYDKEQNLKSAAEQVYDQAKASTKDYEAKETASQAEPFSPLKERLRSDLGNLESQSYRSARALDILQRHPEFEEFIELLGLIRVPLRVAPIHSAKALVIE